MKLSLAALLFFTLVFTSSVFKSITAISPTGKSASLSVFFDSITATTPTGKSASLSVSVSAPSGFGCGKKCELRCSRSGRRDRCLNYCGVCCGKCSGCVPAGPYADKAQCPCYRDMKNAMGTSNCP